VLLWQSEVHKPGDYDLEVDTSVSSPVDCAMAIARRLNRASAESAALRRLAAAP
jgi:chloramphenicol 3-O phosphotransferase